ncbi:hypothetical protein F2Q70_00034861 [Brassica cretica]|uniref:Uncharacterized protein n=1 Tax=Brassica cretica TaxID=69181 RepID=A0A8S9JUQ8_BRACR|nr:hypothetical protein F2Q70_00034861 [Brassica cretica]
MGIDPMTHQHLNQEPNNTNNPQNLSSNSDDISMKPRSGSTKETNGTLTEDESSSTVTGQNNSTDNENHLLSNIYDDEELFSHLWSDETTTAEASWSDSNDGFGGTLYHHDNNMSGAGADFPIWSPEGINGNDWTFLDYCQDFGVHDFGF